MVTRSSALGSDSADRHFPFARIGLETFVELGAGLWASGQACATLSLPYRVTRKQQARRRSPLIRDGHFGGALARIERDDATFSAIRARFKSRPSGWLGRARRQRSMVCRPAPANRREAGRPAREAPPETLTNSVPRIFAQNGRRPEALLAIAETCFRKEFGMGFSARAKWLREKSYCSTSLRRCVR